MIGQAVDPGRLAHPFPGLHAASDCAVAQVVLVRLVDGDHAVVRESEGAERCGNRHAFLDAPGPNPGSAVTPGVQSAKSVPRSSMDDALCAQS